MNNRSVFAVRPEHVERTLRDSTSVMASPCTFEAANGVQGGGVAVFTGGSPRITLTAEAALRLAHQIADALEDLRKLA